MLRKTRYELVFKSDGTPKQEKAIGNIIDLVNGLIAISNNQALKQRMSLRVSLKLK